MEVDVEPDESEDPADDVDEPAVELESDFAPDSDFEPRESFL